MLRIMGRRQARALIWSRLPFRRGFRLCLVEAWQIPQASADNMHVLVLVGERGILTASLGCYAHRLPSRSNNVSESTLCGHF
jgi:hypothetical protein